MQVLLATCGSWHLRQTARAFQERGALGGLWITDKNSTGLPADKYRRCWAYHLAMKPLYHFASQIWTEKAFYFFIGLWKGWLRRQLAAGDCPRFDVVQAIMGFATEVFDHADAVGALKVVDCPNTHPTTYHGFWQRECDLWCPGEKVPIPRWMFARMNRELERANLIVVQSVFSRDSMILNGIPAEKVMINVMGVETSIFKPRESVPEKTRFVCVGTICLRKGHQYLMRAFQRVKAELPDAELICVGDYKQDFRKERPKWEGMFTHIRHLPHPQVAELLRTATAFVFPSQEEGIARAQVEALACGLPVIGTYPGGATTLVEDGVEGLIVPTRDSKALANAMIRLAKDRELNRRMGEAAHQRGAVNNNWQNYGDRLLAEYRRQIGA